MSDVEILREKYETLQPFLSERYQRIWAATEARSLGRGGITRVAEATGLSRQRIMRGLQEIDLIISRSSEEMKTSGISGSRPRGKEGTGKESEGVEKEADGPGTKGFEGAAVLVPERQRRPGGGRKHLTETDPTLLLDLEGLVEPLTRGDPESPLRWTCKSTVSLAEELQRHGHRISPRQVGYLLHEQGYSLQAARKTREGGSHPDRNAQFEWINAQTGAFQERGQPVISVDTKKKELVGSYANRGVEWQPRGRPEEVRTHDFPDPKVSKAIPYGIYDVTANEGWVSVGMDHDTAEFACHTIEAWWKRIGRGAYPEANELLIVADGGGSNGSRSRLWKWELQGLADRTGWALTVCHFPPGTSKWNQIEHHMFNRISQNWRGRPLVSYEVIVELIGRTRTRKGLRIEAALDRETYALGREVSDQQLSSVQLEKHSFHGEWNYTIHPSIIR